MPLRLGGQRRVRTNKPRQIMSYSFNHKNPRYELTCIQDVAHDDWGYGQPRSTIYYLFRAKTLKKSPICISNHSQFQVGAVWGVQTYHRRRYES